MSAARDDFSGWRGHKPATAAGGEGEGGEPTPVAVVLGLGRGGRSAGLQHKAVVVGPLQHCCSGGDVVHGGCDDGVMARSHGGCGKVVCVHDGGHDVTWCE